MEAKIIAAAAVGFAAGLLIGTKQGRKQYEQIKRQVADLVNTPRVQKGLSDAQQFASDKVPVVGETVASAIGVVRDAARDTSESESPQEGSRSGTTSPGSS